MPNNEKNTEDESLLLLLEQASDLRRAEEEKDAKWRALTDGALDERQKDELRAGARQAGEGHLEELFRPFDDVEQQRMLNAVRAQRAKERSEARRRALRQKAPWAAAMVVSVAAAAVGLAPSIMTRAPAGMADYVIDGSRGDSNRSNEWRRLRAMEDTFMVRLLRVRDTVKRVPEVRFLCEQGARRLACLPRTEVMKNGDLLVSGKRQEVFPDEIEGQWDLCVQLSAPGKGPSARELADHGCNAEGGYEGYQVIKVRFVLDRPNQQK